MKHLSRNLLITLGMFFCVPLFSGSSDNQTWPNFRGNSYDGIGKHDGLFKKGFGLEVSWQKELGSGYSSISLADGIAVTMFSDGTDDFMIGLDAQTGKELWKYKIAATYKGHDGSHDGTISTPVIDGKHVYGLGAFGHLFALELKSGKPLWAQHVVDDLDGKAQTYGFGTSPLVAGNVLVVQTGGENAAISGLDKMTGKRLWKTGNDVISYQSPILGKLLGVEQLICPGDNLLFGIDPKNGKLLWEYKHDGQNGSYNPVKIGEDRLFFRTRNEGVMLRASKKNDTYQFEELWKSRELRNTSNVTVYHQGHLFGYSGRFLTCVKAETGERVWKSRPPGDGFLILVEDKLVVVTKAGTLHLIAASPTGYQEHASIEALNSLTWTPPSFGYGKVFVRNLSHIAAVDVGREKTQMIATDDQKHGVLPQTEFGEWVKKVKASSDKKAMIDAFMKSQKSFPLIEKNRYVHVVYRGPAKDVAITGDHLNTGTEHVLNAIPETDFSYYSFELKPNAHISYRLAIDYEPPGLDPRNPYKGEGFQGEDSLVAMPKSEGAFNLKGGEPAGKLVSMDFESKITGSTRKVQVYLPPGYDQNENRFPVLYAGYGTFVLEQGQMTSVLETVIGKSVKPFIGVFVDLSPANNFGELGGEPGKKYVQMLAQELAPHIDATYRTQSKASSRAVLGASSAGYSALLAGLLYGDVFGMVATQSVNLTRQRDEEVAKLITEAKNKDVRFVVEWGLYGSRNANGLDFPGTNSALAKQLKEKGFTVNGGEKPLGNGWANWRTRFDDILRHLFPIDAM